MQAIFGDVDILGECYEAALLVASQLRVDRLAAQAELGGDFGDRETISDYAEHGVVTLLRLA
jgi:hypothetical protein